ncbi:hypothetical protein LPJ53_006541, partial [Coemansia erecta]
LILYMRGAYVSQFNRRFIWGMTLCGDAVRVCNFGNDHMLASREMRLSEESGRARFIKYLVYWSFCEEHCLGYDPTMAWLPGPECWQIAVPTLPETAGDPYSVRTKFYYTSKEIASADHLFGRHTRSFLATDTLPTDADGSHYSKCKYVIKDSWVESTPNAGDDERDEIGHLGHIHEKLKYCKKVRGNYPTIVAGGRVQFDRSDGKGI